MGVWCVQINGGCLSCPSSCTQPSHPTPHHSSAVDLHTQHNNNNNNNNNDDTLHTTNQPV